MHTGGRDEVETEAMCSAQAGRKRLERSYEKYNYGDVAQNANQAGHAHRHTTLLTSIAAAVRSVWDGPQPGPKGAARLPHTSPTRRPIGPTLRACSV